MAEYEAIKKGKLDLYLNLENGMVCASISSYARMVGIHKQIVADRVKKHPEVVVGRTLGNRPVLMIGESFVRDWLLADYARIPNHDRVQVIREFYQYLNLSLDGVLEGCRGNTKRFDPNSPTGKEHRIRDFYHLRYGGDKEYVTSHGRIDLLTDSAIYEIKIFQQYKHCLGQLLTYSHEVPRDRLVAVLFNVHPRLEFDGKECSTVKRLFEFYGIEVELMR